MAHWTAEPHLALAASTTGPNPNVDAIWDMGAAVVRGGVLLRHMGMRINPGRTMPEHWHDAHGVPPEVLLRAPHLKDMASRLLRHIEGASILVAYDWPTLYAFMKPALPGLDEAVGTKPILDPRVVLRLKDVGRFWKGGDRHKLSTVCARFGLNLEAPDGRAWSDAERGAQVLWRFRNRLPADVDEAAQFIIDQRLTQKMEFRDWRG